MLAYKLAMSGITLVKQTEAYTSQCSPHAPEISRKYIAVSGSEKTMSVTGLSAPQIIKVAV